MKKNTTRKLLLPLFLMTLCFTFIKIPAPLPANSDEPVSQIMPLSDREPNDNPHDD